MRKHCKNFIDWVVSQYNEFCTIVDNSLHLSHCIYSTTSSIVASIYNERTGKSGRASVKIDKFDDPTLIAIGLAWANYKNEEVPDFKIPLCRLTTNDKFIYAGQEYRYLTSNPYSTDNIIVCDSYGKPFNLHKSTRITPC